MPTTGLSKLRYPNSSDDPDVPGDMLNLAQDIARNIDGVADAAARAALVTNGYAFEEMFVYQRDTKVQYVYRGAAWVAWESDWITWSTAPTNFAVGTGGSVLSLQRYRYVSGRVLFWCHYILGTTSFSVTGQPTLNLPINLQQPVARSSQLVGEGSIYDVSTGATVYYVKPRLNGTAANQIAVSLYTGTYAAISAGTPMTWAAGDEMALEFWGDPA